MLWTHVLQSFCHDGCQWQIEVELIQMSLYALLRFSLGRYASRLNPLKTSDDLSPVETMSYPVLPGAFCFGFA